MGAVACVAPVGPGSGMLTEEVESWPSLGVAYRAVPAFGLDARFMVNDRGRRLSWVYESPPFPRSPSLSTSRPDGTVV